MENKTKPLCRQDLNSHNVKIFVNVRNEIDMVIKARNLVRKNPELIWQIFVKPTDPKILAHMKEPAAMITNYKTARDIILAAELRGEEV